MLILKDDFYTPLSVLDEFFKPLGPRSTESTRFNALTDEYGLTIEGFLPGLSLDDITIEIDDSSRMLTISGDKKETQSSENVNYLFKEFEQTKFTRSYKIPKKYDLQSADAKLTNGILTLTFDKSSEVDQVRHRRRLEIKTE